MTEYETRPFPLDELRSSGLLYLANRALHPYGVAIAAQLSEEGSVAALSAVETADPLGFVFGDDAEYEARGRLLEWLAVRVERARRELAERAAESDAVAGRQPYAAPGWAAEPEDAAGGREEPPDAPEAPQDADADAGVG